MQKGETRAFRQKRVVGVVHPLRFVGDDEAMLEALKSGHVSAVAALYDRYAGHIRRVLLRIVGDDSEIGDLLQEVHTSPP